MKASLYSILGILLCAMVLVACGRHDNHEVDMLNDRSYAFHYRNLDSTRYYAEAALRASGSYLDGYAEALNHLAFVDIVKMNYAMAGKRLAEIKYF